MLLIVVILLLAGIAFTAIGRKFEREARLSASWPVVNGQLEQCEVVEKRSSRIEDPSTWNLEIRYSYVVHSITHNSTRYAYGYGGGIDDKKYQRAADELKRNPQLSVHYNPIHPSEAVICTDPQTSLTKIGHGCLVTAVIATIIWFIK